MSDMNYRTSYEYPHPNRKLVAHFLRNAKTAGERKVWRDMLNSGAFHKPKTTPVSDKKVKKEAAPPTTNKKRA